MGSFEELTQAVTCRYHDKIKKACTPLFNYFNLNDFLYYKITNSGYKTFLACHVAWSEYFAAEKFYLNSPYYHHPKFFQDGVSLLRAVPDKPFLKVLNSGRDKFNINHCFILINKTQDGLEGFGFSSNCSDELLNAALINELPLFLLFIKRFRKENQFLFSKLEDNQIYFAELLGSAFYEKSTTVTPQWGDKSSFLKAFGVENPLSSREIDVIKLLPSGYSASQIGERLFLSKRTVEHHVERIKEKLGCESRAELIQKARELEVFGYFT